MNVEWFIAKQLKRAYQILRRYSLLFPFTFDKDEDFIFVSSRIVFQALALCLSACSGLILAIFVDMCWSSDSFAD